MEPAIGSPCIQVAMLKITEEYDEVKEQMRKDQFQDTFRGEIMREIELAGLDGGSALKLRIAE